MSWHDRLVPGQFGFIPSRRTTWGHDHPPSTVYRPPGIPRGRIVEVSGRPPNVYRVHGGFTIVASLPGWCLLLMNNCGLWWVDSTEVRQHLVSWKPTRGPTYQRGEFRQVRLD